MVGKSIGRVQKRKKSLAFGLSFVFGEQRFE
jgi:hypothetical protein